MEFQRTIRDEAVLEGVGLHTGKHCRAFFRPAPANAGIRFFRADLPGTPCIPARLAFVTSTERGTTLSLGEADVHTVEHILSACTGLGIDNLDVILDAPEPPAGDGSALPIAKALLAAGISDSRDALKRILQIPEMLRYESGKTSYIAVPSDRFEVLATIEHEQPVPLKQSLSLVIDPGTYMGQVAGARTFAFAHEMEYLRSRGLSKGGSLKNAILISKDKVQTEGGLRFPDEFVRHKILDLIGDLTLIGRSLFRVRIEARRCGHTHNIRFAKILNEAAAKMRRLSPVTRGANR